MKLRLFRINTPEFLKLPSTKRKEAEAKRLKEEAYIKAEEARQERAAKQRQQMEEHYEETRKCRERESCSVAEVNKYSYLQMLTSNVETKVLASTSTFVDDEPVYVGKGGAFSGGGGSSHWTYDPPKDNSQICENILSETCSSSSDSSSSDSSSSN